MTRPIMTLINAAAVILFKDPPPQPATTTARADGGDTLPEHGVRDPYSALLSSAGYATRYMPVLCTSDLPAALEPVLALDPLPEAFIVTSARAARVFAEVAAASKTMPATATVWAVGQATSQPLLSLPGIAVLGTDAGNAQELSDQILDHYRTVPDRPLAVLRGDKSLDTVPTRLRAAGFNVVEVQVYATSARADMPVDQLGAKDVHWWVFFSPSGVDVVRAALQGKTGGGLPGEQVRIAAIGQTTAKYLASDEVGWRVAAVAARPTAEGLVEAIVLHDLSRNDDDGVVV